MVAILDKEKSNVTLIDIKSAKEYTRKIPYNIIPITIFLNNENLFIGGEMGEEILIQFNLKKKKWFKLKIPDEVLYEGKAIDDIVINDSLLIAIDNIVWPKYVLFYKLISKKKLKLSHYKKLKSNGPAEWIYQGRITENYLGLISKTFSLYDGVTDYITIYNDLDMESSFSLSSNQNDEEYITFTDIVIVGKELIIASKEKGLGIIEIKNSYFKSNDETIYNLFNTILDNSESKFEEFENETIVDLTIISNKQILILTLKDEDGKYRHQMRKL